MLVAVHALAGKAAPKELLTDVEKLRKEFYVRKPDATPHEGLGAGPVMKAETFAAPLRSVSSIRRARDRER